MYTKLKGATTSRFRKPQILCGLRALERRLDSLLHRLKETQYDDLTEEQYLALTKEVEGYFKTARKRFKADSKHKAFYAKALAAKFGGEISPSIFLDPKFADFCQFIEANAMMHKMQTLKMKLEVGEEGAPVIRIDLDSNGYTNLVEWESLTKQPTSTGYRFTYFGHEVFCTDSKYKLIDDYILTFKGVTRYHPVNNNEIIAFDKRNPNEWGSKYLVEIWTLIKDPTGERPRLGIGDHCHIILKDSKGYVYSMGKFGQGKELSIKDYFTIFGPKKGRYMSPDVCSYYSQTTRNLKKATLEVSKEQFERLFKILHEDKQKEPTFSILKRNCASYVQKTVGKALNVHIDSELYLPHFALRALIPKRLYNGMLNTTKKVVNRCPRWMQRAFYFFPLLYIPTLVAGLILRSMSGNDLTFKDIFLHPWNLTIYTPIALRESLAAQSQ